MRAQQTRVRNSDSTQRHLSSNDRDVYADGDLALLVVLLLGLGAGAAVAVAGPAEAVGVSVGAELAIELTTISTVAGQLDSFFSSS